MRVMNHGSFESWTPDVQSHLLPDHETHELPDHESHEPRIMRVMNPGSWDSCTPDHDSHEPRIMRVMARSWTNLICPVTEFFNIVVSQVRPVTVFLKHNFRVKPYVPREPRRDPSNRRLNEHGIYIWHCQESNTQPVPSKAGVDTTTPQWRTDGPFDVPDPTDYFQKKVWRTHPVPTISDRWWHGYECRCAS